MRKNIWCLTVLVLSGAFLAGCQASQAHQYSMPDSSTISYAEANGGVLEPISADSVSQNVYDALQYEWDAWNSMSRESQMLSCHRPGHCQCDFDDWTECEEFLGFSVPNPLEACAWLEKATYAAMPASFRDAQHVTASWYGTEDGHVEWISIQAGYRSGQICVTIAAALYGDPADTKPTDSGWSVELERQDYLANMNDSQLQIIAENTEKYYSNVAYQAYGNVLYRFNIVGQPDEQTEVENTLEQVVNTFSKEYPFN